MKLIILKGNDILSGILETKTLFYPGITLKIGVLLNAT